MTQFLRDDLTDDGREFHARLNQAWEHIRIGLQAVIDTIPQTEERNTVPLNTVWRLEVGLATRSLAAIQNLTLAQTSESSLILLRTCLEAFAHLEFIRGLRGARGTTACRALRYELGAAREARDAILKIDADTTSIETEYQRRVAELRKMPTGCNCKRHALLDRGHVVSTLKALADRDGGLRILPLIYSDGSRAAHMFSGADHIVELNDQGEPELTWVPLYKRAGWFVWTLIVFGRATFAAEIIVDCPTGSGFEASGAAEGIANLINDPFFERIGGAPASRRPSGPAK